MTNLRNDSLQLHQEHRGKLEVRSKVALTNERDLSLVYSPQVIGTGRSDFPNQVNNVLAFPGIFRGALDVCANQINDEMKIAAVIAIADLLEEQEIQEDYVIPRPFDMRVAKVVGAEVSQAAIETGVARHLVVPEEQYEKVASLSGAGNYGTV